MEPAPVFCRPVSSWFFSIKCPGEHFRTIHSLQNEGTPGLELSTCRIAVECSTTELTTLEFRDSAKHPVFTRIHKMGIKMLFLEITMIFCLPDQNADWDASVCFLRKDLFLRRTSNTVFNYSTTQLFRWWFLRWTGHSPCTRTVFPDGNQLLISVNMVKFHSSPTNVLVNASEDFPHYKMLRNSQVRTRILSDSTRMLNHWSISTWTSYLDQPICLCWYTDKW